MTTPANRLHGFAHWIGIQPASTPTRIVQAFIGSALGILFTGAVMHLWLGHAGGLPLLIAPMGASAVLLFAVPASPLAQPWAIIGGNTISALSGILWMKLIGDPATAAGLAVATAIAMMSLARCLHPPGGAVALTTVIGGPAVVGAGWGFALLPVLVNCLLLVGIGWLFNAAVRGNYPHRAAAYVAPPAGGVGYTIADVDEVLAHYDDLLDVSSEDLDTLFRQVESRAWRRLHGVIRCAQIMREARALAPEASLQDAERAMAAQDLHALPVVAPDGHVEGLLGVAQLGGQGMVSQAMDRSPCIASADTPIDEVLPILSGGRYHEAIIVDGHGRYLGLVTQTELLSALWRGHIAEAIAGKGA
ncbi:HPP family protein [Novosphingobium terrae]|uniref:HPP family protein n=1 Tax=Novosphingobium terrae TaxID=2726189 RepID=UPI00197DE64F|nr:HPP family protein [Novosphingobium terrae]